MRYGRSRSAVLLFSLLALALGVVGSPAPAEAVGSGVVEFSASGRLQYFPIANYHTDFWGQATGAGVLTGSSGGTVVTAEFTHLAMPVSGWVDYGTQGLPFCPLVGTAGNNPAATGHITVGSSSLPGTTGITYSTGRTNTGIVTGLVYSFDLTYTRVGAAATIFFGIPPGTAKATVYFTTPGVGAGQFTVPIAAVGEAFFYTDYVQATMNCINNGGPSLDYQLTGVVTGAST